MNLIPRDFKGVMSRTSDTKQMQFKNPKPYIDINDWFFGAAVQYAYDTTGSSPSA